ncbi:MAG: hypothetical protein E4H19_00720 [Chromatiales bacterium]|nr:MAG: hypothetical protein E4H19_00720 [Chromatiales bacterium]
MSFNPESRSPPRILYVPGIRAKPPPASHRAILWRCVLEGVRRADPEAAASLAAAPDCLRLALWGHLLYPEYRDIALDDAGIAALLANAAPGRDSIREAFGLWSRAEIMAYRCADRFPGLIDWLAAEDTRINLEDSGQYFRNADGIGDRIRDVLRIELQRCWAAGERILLMTHSFGSVIAWDTLWSLKDEGGPIDLFLTLGSPLGTHYIRRRLMGSRARGAGRYPRGIRRWHNLAATGELTALGHNFAEDFAAMQDLGLVAGISDRQDLRNPYRDAEGLNVHKCYAYFVNAATGEAIARWWRERAVSSSPSVAASE